MPVDPYIARGPALIGDGWADRLRENRVIAQRNALAEQQAAQGNALIGAQIDNIYADNQRANVEMQQKAQAEQAKASQEWIAAAIGTARQNPSAIPYLISEGKRRQFIPQDFPDTLNPQQLDQLAIQYSVPPAAPRSPGTLYKLADGRYATAEQAIGQRGYQEPRATDTERAPPSGYRWKPDGSLEPVPGGPSDPQGPGARKASAPLRKEFRGLQSVKDFETSLPLLVSARKAPDTPQGDLQVIYTVGKVLDPGSVVREGELQLTQNAAPWLQQVVGQARAQIQGKGRLTPETRAGLLDALNQRVLAYRQAYDRDFQQYSQYATDAGVTPSDIVGSHYASAFQTSPSSSPQQPLPVGQSKTINGVTITRTK